MRLSLCLTSLLVVMSLPIVSVADSSDVYSRRVLPLLRAPEGSSCKECHLSGIELNDFFSEDEKDTFAKLRASGWVNVDNPERSKLLEFIARTGDKTPSAIQEVRKNEQSAIAAWLKSAISNPELLSHRTKDDVGIELDDKLIRHLRSDRVLARFTDNIWSVMGQCINCHSPERNQRQVKKHGEQMSWITPHDPQATLNYLLDAGLIDMDDPDASEIRTKPTVIVEHGGGPKFPVGSATDKRFLAFLRDYEKVSKDEYKSNRQLPGRPGEYTRLTEHHLRLTHLPEEWAGKLLRVDLFARTDDGWSKQRVATADSSVAPKPLIWQNPLWSTAKEKSHLAERFSEGRYLARIYLDRNDRLKQDADSQFAKADIVATLEIGGTWDLGWRNPKIVDASDLQQP